MINFWKQIRTFIIGAFGYGTIEILFRGTTHWTMLVAGGICFSVLYAYNTKNENAPLWKKCLTGAFIITSIELAVGIIVNLWLGWDVWDYSAYSYDFLGQICLAFTTLWFLLCIPISFFTRYLHRNEQY